MAGERKRSYKLSPPVGGLNAISGLDAMPETDAIELDNIYPANTRLESLYGRDYTTALPVTTGSVTQTMAGFTNQDPSSFSDAMIAVSGKKLCYRSAGIWLDATLANTVTQDAWSYLPYKERLFMVNGIDPPLTATQSLSSNAVVFTPTAWTGPDDINKLVNIGLYKERLYFIEAYSNKVWYGGVGGVSGALTSYDTSNLFKKGGYPVICGSTSGSFSRESDSFVIISSKGECAHFQGSYPGSSTWNIVGTSFVTPPAGPRAAFYYGPFMYCITNTGIKKITPFGVFGAEDKDEVVSNKVDSLIRGTFKGYGTFFGDDGYHSISDTALYQYGGAYNPVRECLMVWTPNGTWYMNPETKAWCSCSNHSLASDNRPWDYAVYQNQVYLALKEYVHTVDDSDADAAPFKIRQAWSSLANETYEKVLCNVKTIIEVGADAPVGLQIGAAMDFDDTEVSGPVAVGVSKVNKEIYSIEGVGEFTSLIIEADEAKDMNIYNSTLYFEDGGYF